MLKAADLAAKTLTSADEHKRVATTLRRLSGGLAAQRGNGLELSDKELAILTDAEKLLDRMAEVRAQAAKLRCEAVEVARARHEAIKAAAASTFGQLSTVADKIALIGAVQSYSLRGNTESWATSRHMLSEVFREAFEGLIYTLGCSDATKPATQIVAEAWAKFQVGRAAIEDQHARLIVAQQRIHGEHTATN